MKRKQHHYTNEQQIIEKIDAKREQARECNETAELLEKKSKELLIEAGRMEETAKTDEQWNEARSTKAYGFACKDDAIKARKTAKRIEQVTIPKLGEALAEFRTTPMVPICGDNHSVASLV